MGKGIPVFGTSTRSVSLRRKEGCESMALYSIDCSSYASAGRGSGEERNIRSTKAIFDAAQVRRP
jgi:hypothetical protein